MIVLDYKDSRPIYEQIVDKFQALILRGILEEDSKMPSVRNLAMELSINPNTIQKAYVELERQGFIYTIKGRGNFVSHKDLLLEYHKQEILEKAYLLIKEGKELGLTKKEVMAYLDHRLEH
ncbi:MAG: GntR family transcriptional regulator [Eubacteriales bacterium]